MGKNHLIIDDVVAEHPGEHFAWLTKCLAIELADMRRYLDENVLWRGDYRDDGRRKILATPFITIISRAVELILSWEATKYFVDPFLFQCERAGIKARVLDTTPFWLEKKAAFSRFVLQRRKR